MTSYNGGLTVSQLKEKQLLHALSRTPGSSHTDNLASAEIYGCQQEIPGNIDIKNDWSLRIG